jgi:hypothetical protein
VQRGDLELLAARLAHQLVVHADQVIAKLLELGAVALVGARRQPVLFDAADPAHRILVGAATTRARVAGRTCFRTIRKERAFVESHRRDRIRCQVSGVRY